MKLVNKPLSSQVKDSILEIIDSLDFMSKLPSEQSLAAEFGVSRNTVREVLKALENEGIVISRHGIGTFVTRYKGTKNIQYNIALLESTSRIISEHGFRPGTKSVFYDTRPASEETAHMLNLELPASIFYLERVRTADDVPIVFVEDYITYNKTMADEFARNTSLPLFELINRYSPISFSNCSIHAVLSDARLMERLSLNEPKALLLLQQIHYSSKGIPVFYSDSYFLTDKLEFNLIRRCIE